VHKVPGIFLSEVQMTFPSHEAPRPNSWPPPLVALLEGQSIFDVNDTPPQFGSALHATYASAAVRMQYGPQAEPTSRRQLASQTSKAENGTRCTWNYRKWTESSRHSCLGRHKTLRSFVDIQLALHSEIKRKPFQLRVR
jgi:hypothetical protein